jgi:hypothetical protein
MSVALFEALSRNLPEGTEEIHGNLNMYSRLSRRVLNAGFPEYETGVIPITR